MDRILAPLLNKSNTNLPFFTRAPSCGVLRNIDNQPMEKRTPKPRASRAAAAAEEANRRAAQPKKPLNCFNNFGNVTCYPNE